MLNRLALGALTLFAASVLIFVGTEILPGDLASAILQNTATPEALAKMRLDLGLNQPAYVTGRRWDVLAWNAAAEEVFGFGRLPEDERNTLIYVLTNPESRRLFGASWPEEARRIVTQFRRTHDLWAGDPAFLDLQARLRQGCPEFDGWWGTHDVSVSVAGRKVLNHSKRGRLTFEYATFQANDDPGLKLIIYTEIR